MQALWLANNSSVILFWPYLKASIFTPVKALMGKTMVFKTTLKGAAAHNASLKVLWPAILIAIINIVSLILGVVNFRASVNAAQVRPRCVPPSPRQESYSPQQPQSTVVSSGPGTQSNSGCLGLCCGWQS